MTALSDDQFWALERWIIMHSAVAAMPPGFHDPAQLQSIRDTAYTALTGKDPVAARATGPASPQGNSGTHSNPLAQDGEGR